MKEESVTKIELKELEFGIQFPREIFPSAAWSDADSRAVCATLRNENSGMQSSAHALVLD